MYRDWISTSWIISKAPHIVTRLHMNTIEMKCWKTSEKSLISLRQSQQYQISHFWFWWRFCFELTASHLNQIECIQSADCEWISVQFSIEYTLRSKPSSDWCTFALHPNTNRIQLQKRLHKRQSSLHTKTLCTALLRKLKIQAGFCSQMEAFER